MPRRHLSLLILPVALSATLLATQNPPAQPPAAPPPQQSEVQLVISSGTGAPPKYAVPDFLALSGDAETRRGRQDHRAGAVGRPGLRARVLHDPARHVRRHSRGALGDRRALRSLARAGRRRPADRHGAEGRLGPEDPGAAVQRRQPADGVLARVHGLGRQPARLRPHDGRRDPPAAARACAASRARS